MKNVSKLLSILLCLAMVVGIFAMTGTAAAGDTATLVTDVSTLANGDKVVILSKDGNNAMGASSGNFFSRVTLSSPASNGSVSVTDTMEELTIVVNSDNTYSFAIENGNHLLSGNNNNNHLKSTTAGSDHTKWTISISSNGDAIITSTTAKKDSTFRQLQYNATSGQERFSTYAGTQQAVRLYKLGGTPAPTVDVTGVTLDETANIQTGFSTTLTATVAPSNATNKAITWTSSDPTVATVSNGKVTGVKAGTATITATTQDGSFTDTCAVTVVDNALTVVGAPVDGPIKLGIAQYAAGKMGYFNGETDGATYRLALTEDISEAVDMYLEAVTGGYHLYFLDADDNNVKTYIEIYEYQTNSGSLKLTTEIPATAYTYNEATRTLITTIGENAYYLGTYNTYTNISANKASFILEDNGSAKAAVDVSQFPARLYATPVTGVTLDKTSQNLVVGGTVDLVATVAPSNATNQDVTWTSSNTAVATVANGKVTAVAAGTATITVTTADGSKTATCTITVVAATVPATGVTLDKTTASLEVGKDVTLTATVAPADSTDAVVWSTSDATIATVAGGKITAVAPGTATITATAGSKSATCTVTVTAAVSKVELNKETASVVVESELDLSATVTANPDAADYKKVTWTTSDATIATVENGKVKALKTGTVTITATSVTDTTKKATCTVTVVSKPAANAGGLITSIEQLKTGTYVLVAGNGFAPATLDGTWLTAAEPTVSGTQIADTKNATWTLTVKDGKVSIKDSTGKYIAPKGGNNNGIKEGEYWWTVECVDGKFSFLGNGEDTVRLACNTESENKFRAYKNTTATGDYAEKYPSTFSVYAVGDTASSTGDTFEPMVIVLALAAVSALAVLALNKKKFSF